MTRRFLPEYLEYPEYPEYGDLDRGRRKRVWWEPVEVTLDQAAKTGPWWLSRGIILLFAVLLSLATSLAFGLVPALQATHPRVVISLKGESTERGGSQQRLRKALVAAQVGLCLILLVGSGLFLRTLRNSLQSDLGFEAENVAVARSQSFSTRQEL